MIKKSMIPAFISLILLALNCSAEKEYLPADYTEEQDSIIQLDDESGGPKGILDLNIYEEQNKNGALYGNGFGNRTALPDVDMTRESFRITGSCSDGSSFSLLTSLTYIQIQNMSVGRWIIKIESLNSEKIGIGYGEGSVDILEDETSVLDISVTPYAGFGIIQVTVEWDADLENPSIQGTISRHNPATIFDLHFEISGNTATAEITGAAGYYILTINLYDSEGESHSYIGGAVEVVRIVEDEITPGIFYIYANSDYGYGDVEVNIEVDMDDPIDIELDGQVASYNSGDTMTVTASSPEETEIVEYTWFLNGELVGTGDTYTTSDTLPAGPYRLDVTAFNEAGDRAGSVTYYFEILIAAPSGLSYSENPAVYTVGIPIADNIAAVTGSEILFSIVPDLPAGLILDGYTGTISGTPQTGQAETIYTVYAENYGGSTSVDLSITVNYEIPLLAVTETAEDHVSLSWTYDYPYITGYEIYRSTVSGVYDYNSPIEVITSSDTSGSYTDYAVDPDTAYYYVIRAYYGFDYSPDSNEATATTTSSSVVKKEVFVDPTATGTGDGASWTNAYTSLETAEENERADLVALGLPIVFKCRGGADAANVEFSADDWTVDEENFITIEVESGDMHSGTRNTGYKLEGDNAWAGALVIGTDYTVVKNVEVENTNSSSAARGIQVTGDESALINCLVYDCAGMGIYLNCNFSNNYAINCIVLNCGGYGIYQNNPLNVYVYNCTVLNCDIGFYGPSGTVRMLHAKNCYAGNNITEDFKAEGHGIMNITSCFSADGTLGTAVAACSTDSGANFVNITSGSEDVHIKAGSLLIGNGVDLSDDSVYPFNTDIDGDYRDSWDVGADEF